MIEIDKKLHKEIKEYCRLNNLVMKEYVNSLLKKAFTADKFGDTPFKKVEEVKPILSTDYETPEPVETIEKPANLPPITNEKIIEKYTKPIEDYNKFYCNIPVDEAWEEKLEENIKNGSIVTMPYIVETNGPMITVNHSKKEETLVQTDKVKKEEKQKKPKKRSL